MTDNKKKQIQSTLWSNMDELRGSIDVYGIQNYTLAFLFLHYLSDKYEKTAIKELEKGLSDRQRIDKHQFISLSKWYKQNPDDQLAFEKTMRIKSFYVIRPEHLWGNIVNLAQTQSSDLLNTLESSFEYIEKSRFIPTSQVFSRLLI